MVQLSTMLAGKRKMHSRGVYVTFRDRTRRKKSESLTVDDLTPKRLLLEFVRFLRQRRKAG